MKSIIRVRMGAEDAHYGGNLVDGAHMLHLFGDVATELLIMNDGDEGLFKAYEQVEFMAPVYAGDYIEAVGPAAGALDSFATTQTGTADGFTYVYFNVYFTADGKVVLRNHFYITGDVTVTLNGNEATLANDECPENVYYLDIVLEAGQYDVAQKIAAGECEISVSLYSYIKVALEKGVSDDQETILRALYDLNEAV